VTQAQTDGRPVVSILTLGCKLNQSDSEAIARRLAGEGVRVVDRPVKGAQAFVSAALRADGAAALAGSAGRPHRLLRGDRAR
jgi:hypothetical protein